MWVDLRGDGAPGDELLPPPIRREKSIHRLGSETNICTGSFGIVHCVDWNGSDVAVTILLEQDFHLENLYEKTRRKVKRQLSPYPFPGLHQIIIIGCNKQLDLKKVSRH
ncbi:unnamed protein product [Lactuca saligna]|uniref:Protein kinase domain-containing protein n=1 Tax=Lactuca saligna TaxID=75948 RepID=A0AA36EB96_LACSI|nr:unnamed protein product [Lactuca saligna]